VYRPAKKQKSHLAPPAQEPARNPRDILLGRVKAPIGPAFHASLPKKQAGEIEDLFKELKKKGISFGEQETSLLKALNLLPENPFVTLRLAFLYAAHGQQGKAAMMLEKSQSLALQAKISLTALENS
jgi:hypothetical protein